MYAVLKRGGKWENGKITYWYDGGVQVVAKLVGSKFLHIFQ